MAYLSRRRPDLSTTFLHLGALFILAAVVFADEAEVEDESEFTYSLNSEKGPENWASLNPNWKACNGTLQSPIDLLGDRVVVLPKLGSLKRKYKPAPAILKNRGHDIMVTWEGRDAGSVVMNGTEYKLLQCHWHTPAEHTVDGERFKMEIHLVHQNSEGQISVIGILYKLGRPDPFLAKLLRTIKTVGHEGTNVGVIDPWEIKFGSRKYLRYIGSLTVPPCTEGVVWTILKKVRTISEEQIRELREAVHDGFEDNSRPIQHDSDVPVFMYRPESQ